MDIELKSILLPPSLSDGLRVFVDRQWPRRVTEEAAKVDLWIPEVGFTRELAQWMTSHPQHALALQRRYFAGLRDPAAEAALEKLYAKAMRRKKVTLLHATKSANDSAASILKMLMEGRSKPPSPTGPAKAAAASGRVAKAKPRRR
ncbi:MAG TPA: DUF488 family protein [Terriglobales bacterium]|nr:DUF488 family protein [Terriglobales bacterium]